MASIAAVTQFIHTYLKVWLLGDHPPFQINFLEIVMLFLGRLSPCGHTYYISIRNFRRVQDSPIFAAERRNMNFFLPMKKRSCNRTRLKIWPSLNSFFFGSNTVQYSQLQNWRTNEYRASKRIWAPLNWP